MATIICVPCKRFFRIERNGIWWEEGFGDGRERPYKLWASDRYECPSCHTQILAGIPPHPIAEHYEKDYSKMRDSVRPQIFIDDCPGRAVDHSRATKEEGR